ncbi:MAG: transcriptional regulator [Rhizobiales bacterium NRL2]|jgi:putative transcriptional regulator|nr:MAG: transcriptional regulator [Rhizobiales bacterium NRL2]
MSIRHHPAETTLIAYAAGHLDEALSAIVASHLAVCPRCRGRSRLAEGIGGELLDSAEPAALRDDALDAVLARIAGAGTETAEPAPRAGRHGVAAPLGQLLPERLSDIRWRTVGPGIRQARLGETGRDPEGLKLLKIAPGRSVPRHTHRGHEMTLIVSGSYTDELGRFQAGDIADLDGEVDHQPVSDTGEDCICIIATDAPLRFEGWVPRLMQPFVRI